MSYINKRYALALYLCLLLAGCSKGRIPTQPGTITNTSASIPLASPTPTLISVSTATPPPQPEPIHPATPSATGTVTPTLAPTRKPTRTASPTTTQTPTISPTLTQFSWSRLDFPAWVSGLGSDVLFVTARPSEEGDYQFMLVNASSGEKYTFPPSDAGGYFWMANGKQLGFLSRDKKVVTLVNVSDGILTHYPASDSVTRFVDTSIEGDAPHAYISSGSSLDALDFVLWEKVFRDEFSQDGRYRTEQDYGAGTSIIDLKTGEKIMVTDPTDGLYDVMHAWSPNGSFLGIAQSDVVPGMYFSFETMPNYMLLVYDAAQAQIVASYKGITFPNWSPDGTKFLYQPVSNTALSFWESPPCIYDTLVDATRCYNEAVLRHHPDGQAQVIFTSTHWLPDQSGFGYLYDGEYSVSSGERGGLCFVRIQDGSERCIFQDFEDLEQTVMHYEISPDGEFVSAAVDASCLLCDFQTAPQLAIANVHTGEYALIGYIYTWGETGLWRPKLAP